MIDPQDSFPPDPYDEELQAIFVTWRQRIPDLTPGTFRAIMRGVLESERIRALAQGRPYFEDCLPADLARHLESLLFHVGAEATFIPPPKALDPRELPRWRRALLAFALGYFTFSGKAPMVAATNNRNGELG